MSTNKRNIIDTQKYIDILSTFGLSGKKIAIFDIGERKTIYSIRQLFGSEVIMEIFEDKSLSNFCNRLPNSVYNNIDSENFDVTQFEKYMNGKHFDLAIMNPAFQIGGEVWDITRQHSDRVVCLMPISKYKKNNRYKYIKNIKAVDSTVFDNTEINYDLFITECDNSMNNYETYEEFFLSVSHSHYYDFYMYNKENNSGVVISEKRNAPVEFFNEETDYVTVNRCCSRIGHFSTENGLDYKWNYEKKRNFTQKEWVSGLAYIRFNSNKALKNFNLFVYDNENSKKLINNTMWGLNMGTVSKTCYLAIPQIDWESISDHPLWIDGKYDEAVLDTMGLKWNDTMDGVVKK